MSTIIADNLTGKTSAGSITVTSEGGAATMQLQQGLAKFFVHMNASAASTQNSLNQSSLTDNGTGDFSHAFVNSMDNVYYTPTGHSYYNASGGNSAIAQWTLKYGAGGLASYKLTSSVRADIVYVDANQNRTNYDYEGVWGTAHGDLA